LIDMNGSVIIFHRETNIRQTFSQSKHIEWTHSIGWREMSLLNGGARFPSKWTPSLTSHQMSDHRPFTSNEFPQSVRMKWIALISSHQRNHLNQFAWDEPGHIKWIASINFHHMNPLNLFTSDQPLDSFTTNEQTQSVRIKWTNSIRSSQMNGRHLFTPNETTQWTNIKRIDSICSHQMN
jgi:hypothetical protein